MPVIYKAITLTVSSLYKISVAFINLTVVLVFVISFVFISSCKRNHTPLANANENKNINSPSDIAVFPYLPAVFNSQANYDTSTSIILTTADVARFDEKTEEKPFVNSVQIIDAYKPWPPRWYTTTPFYSDEEYKKNTAQHQYRFDFVIDAKIDAGYFSFFKILSKQKMGVGQLESPDFAGYILLNEKMEPVDTIKSNNKRSNMYFHDLRINAQGEKMVDLKKDTYLDLRDYTDDPKDSSVHCYIDYIHILDSNDKAVFTWNPMQHFSPDVFNYKATIQKRAFAARHADMVEWTRLTSALWDYDGNILYSMKQIGIGKVSRKDGHIMWQVNYSDIPIVSGKDTLEWYNPHDFNLLSENTTSATYSLYSDGAEGKKPAVGVVFEINKKTQKLKLVKYLWPKTVYWAVGQGNVEYHPNGDYAMGYGFFEASDTGSVNSYRSVLEYQLASGPWGVYQLPQWIYTYKARLLKNWPRPPRPEIIRKGDVLEATGDFKDFTWYKLSGANLTTATKAGTGNVLKPEKGNTYCVESKYGIGYSVSLPFTN
jgi:hypothetical protein